MPNNLTPADVVIVPNEAVTAQIKAIEDSVAIDDEHQVCNGSWVYDKIIEAAPKDHNLIAVDKGELVKTISRLKGVVDGNPMTALWLNPIIHDISKIYVTALQAAVKAAGGQ